MNPRYRQDGYETLHEDYERLLDRLKGDKRSMLSKWLVGGEAPLLPSLEPVWLSIERHEFAMAAVEDLVAHFAVFDGWLRRRSGLFMTVAGNRVRTTGEPSAHGPPLSGAWALAPEHSVALSYEGAAWVMREFREASAKPADQDDAASGKVVMPALAQTVTTHAVGRWTMLYRIYWGADSESDAPGGRPTAMRRLAERFIGFGWAKEDRT